MPQCVACTSSHGCEECCCGQRARESPSYLPGKILRECIQGTCRFAMERTIGKDWSYSFEAERSSCSKRQANTASTACKGIVGSSVASLATTLPHVAKEPSNTLKYIIKLGSHASSRPIFQSLLAEACDKLAFIKQASPDVYYGTGDGIRSSFCSHSSIMGQCIPCQMLEGHATTMYASRAE